VDEEVDRKAELLGKSVCPVGLVAFFLAKKHEMKNTNVTGDESPETGGGFHKSP